VECQIPVKIRTNAGYIHIYDRCLAALDPGERPNFRKCMGVQYNIRRVEGVTDSKVYYMRGYYKLTGYFSNSGYSGPHQGLMGGSLRPLNIQDVPT
jgi:hypothetical protein